MLHIGTAMARLRLGSKLQRPHFPQPPHPELRETRWEGAQRPDRRATGVEATLRLYEPARPQAIGKADIAVTDCIVSG